MNKREKIILYSCLIIMSLLCTYIVRGETMPALNADETVSQIAVRCYALYKFSPDEFASTNADWWAGFSKAWMGEIAAIIAMDKAVKEYVALPAPNDDQLLLAAEVACDSMKTGVHNTLKKNQENAK